MLMFSGAGSEDSLLAVEKWGMTMLPKEEEQLLPFAEGALALPVQYGWGERRQLHEFDYLKQQAARLYRLNKLHRRLAGTLHLAGLVEAFSLWLKPFLPHLVFGYCPEDGECRHFSSHVHGEERRKVMAFVRSMGREESDGSCLQYGEYLRYKWEVKTADGAGFLFVVCRKKPEADKFDLMNDALDVLVENLHRGLEYEKIHFQATRDALTGLANRRVFDQQGRELMTAARQHGYPVTLMLLDLDNFKAVNDTLGHLRGDEALVAVADILRSTVRATDLVARIGGDEFALILDNTDLSGAKIFADRMCKAVDDLGIQPLAGVRLGVSVGLSLYNGKENLASWIERTDSLLYQAKAVNRGGTVAEVRNQESGIRKQEVEDR